MDIDPIPFANNVKPPSFQLCVAGDDRLLMFEADTSNAEQFNGQLTEAIERLLVKYPNKSFSFVSGQDGCRFVIIKPA